VKNNLINLIEKDFMLINKDTSDKNFLDSLNKNVLKIDILNNEEILLQNNVNEFKELYNEYLKIISKEFLEFLSFQLKFITNSENFNYSDIFNEIEKNEIYMLAIDNDEYLQNKFNEKKGKILKPIEEKDLNYMSAIDNNKHLQNTFNSANEDLNYILGYMYVHLLKKDLIELFNSKDLDKINAIEFFQEIKGKYSFLIENDGEYVLIENDGEYENVNPLKDKITEIDNLINENNTNENIKNKLTGIYVYLRECIRKIENEYNI